MEHYAGFGVAKGGGCAGVGERRAWGFCRSVFAYVQDCVVRQPGCVLRHLSLWLQVGDHQLSSIAVQGNLQSGGRLVAVGDVNGTVSLIEVCDSLAVSQPNEKVAILGTSLRACSVCTSAHLVLCMVAVGSAPDCQCRRVCLIHEEGAGCSAHCRAAPLCVFALCRHAGARGEA